MNLKKQILLVISGGILICSITIPISLYVWKFGSWKVASDPDAWGVFGDYVGGVLNPIISLASLIVLGYLTYLMAQQTNRESKNLFILERRMLAYDELAKFIKPINAFMTRIENATSLIPVYEKLSVGGGQQLVGVFKEIRDITTVFMEFHYTLFEFRPRFGHLFQYNFNSDEYNELLSESKRVAIMMSKLASGDGIKISKEERTLRKFQELIFPVFAKLRAEIEP